MPEQKTEQKQIAANGQSGLQNAVLNAARTTRTPVRIFLTNGFQFQANVIAFDNFSILVTDEQHRQNLIYKHAVSTVSPSKPLNIKIDD